MEKIAVRDILFFAGMALAWISSIAAVLTKIRLHMEDHSVHFVEREKGRVMGHIDNPDIHFSVGEKIEIAERRAISDQRILSLEDDIREINRKLDILLDGFSRWRKQNGGK